MFHTWPGQVLWTKPSGILDEIVVSAPWKLGFPPGTAAPGTARASKIPWNSKAAGHSSHHQKLGADLLPSHQVINSTHIATLKYNWTYKFVQALKKIPSLSQNARSDIN